MAMVLMTGLAAAAETETAQPAAELRLPPPSRAGTMSLNEALAQRRSVRDFSPAALTLTQISQLAWAAQGVSAPGHRTAPSAGATYPLELYFAVGNVEGLAPGVYRYVPERHSLEVGPRGDLRRNIADAALGQEWVSHAAAIVVISAVPSRTAARYGKRAERYVNIEAGHAAENVLLQATALGLAAAPVGAFDDGAVSRLLHLPKDEAPLYMIPLGTPAR